MSNTDRTAQEAGPRFNAGDNLVVKSAADWLSGFAEPMWRETAAEKVTEWRYFAALGHGDLLQRVLDNFQPDPIKDFLATPDEPAPAVSPVERAVREWAAVNGMPVPDGAEVPAVVRAAFLAAQEVPS